MNRIHCVQCCVQKFSIFIKKPDFYFFPVLLAWLLELLLHSIYLLTLSLLRLLFFHANFIFSVICLFPIWGFRDICRNTIISSSIRFLAFLHFVNLFLSRHDWRIHMTLLQICPCLCLGCLNTLLCSEYSPKEVRIFQDSHNYYISMIVCVYQSFIWWSGRA